MVAQVSAPLLYSSDQTSRIRIACIQANPTVGDLQGNLDIVRRYRRNLRDEVDLLVFSECFASGYPLGDLVLRPGFVRDVRKAVDDFSREIDGDGGPAVLVGAPREGAARAYNSVYLLETDGTVQVVDKHRLPNEEVYDEQRTFAAGGMPQPLTFRGVRIGVPICEDFWHGDVNRTLVEAGAEMLIVPNGSHYKAGKQRVRVELAREAARRLHVPVLYVNQVGGQDELVFDGGSFAMARNGSLLSQASFHEAALRVDAVRVEDGFDLEVSVADMVGNGGAVNIYPGELEADYQAMVLGLRDYVRKSGFARVVLGMSGGLDSALSAAVAVDALGADNVLLVRMPGKLTSQASMDDAAEAARLLGTALETISIESIVAALEAATLPLFSSRGRTGRDTTEENMQARARGMILMSISNKLGYMLLTTGNKSEMSVGYATLYGDMAGGFSVLKDCYKTTVFALARWRNKTRPHSALGPVGPVMPQAIIDKPPTAELSPDQTDEATLGSYDHLDAVLHYMVEGLNTPLRAAMLATTALRKAALLAAEDIEDRELRDAARARAGLVEVGVEYALRIARLVRLAQYKRRQAPPGVVLTARDFGQGWRLPIAGDYTL